MIINKHSNNSLSICKYTFGFIFYTFKELWEKNMLEDDLALIEEYRECFADYILKDNTLYLIDKR